MIQVLGSKIRSWVSKNKLEFLLLVIILAVGTFLRLYKIDQYMTFLGDEGRDVIVVRNLLVHSDPILIGPGSSVGNIYLGPLYYYMMAPALLLANFSPVGPAVMVALFGVATIFFLWFVIRTWFPNLTMVALLVSLLYAVSPTTIIFSRSSWNPNIMPFFALLTIWSISRAWAGSYKWLLIAGVSFAFVLNSHYLGVLLAPVILIYWIASLRAIKKNVTRNKRQETRKFLSSSLISFFLFLLLMSPLLIFDLRHNFQNFKAMIEFVSHPEGSFKGVGVAIESISAVYTQLFTRLLAGRNEAVGLWTAVISTIFLVNILMLRKRKTKIPKPPYIVFLWLMFGVVGLAFVQKEIYDHYLGFLFPVPFLLLALVAKRTVDIMPRTEGLRYVMPALTVLAFGVLIVVSIQNSPLKDNPSRQLARSRDVTQKILDVVGSKPFDLAVLATSNYEDGYRYFLEVAGATVLHADPWHTETISDTLMVVCEKPEQECRPTLDPKAEIANFGPSKVDEQWEVDGTQVYKLSHNQL